jgi:hypothetical protein
VNGPTSSRQELVSMLVGMWEVQEALLQQYRTIFITMQSIFVAVAAAIMQGKPQIALTTDPLSTIPRALLLGDGPWIPMALLSVLAWYVLKKLWLPICTARGRTVYLIQYFILKAEKGDLIEYPLKTVKEFHDKEHPEIESDPMFRALDGGETRRKMEEKLPKMFMWAWGFLWLTLILQNYYILVGPR